MHGGGKGNQTFDGEWWLSLVRIFTCGIVYILYRPPHIWALPKVFIIWDLELSYSVCLYKTSIKLLGFNNQTVFVCYLTESFPMGRSLENQLLKET